LGESWKRSQLAIARLRRPPWFSDAPTAVICSIPVHGIIRGQVDALIVFLWTRGAGTKLSLCCWAKV
jgi:hypothetical protein